MLWPDPWVSECLSPVDQRFEVQELLTRTQLQVGREVFIWRQGEAIFSSLSSFLALLKGQTREKTKKKKTSLPGFWCLVARGSSLLILVLRGLVREKIALSL